MYTYMHICAYIKHVNKYLSIDRLTNFYLKSNYLKLMQFSSQWFDIFITNTLKLQLIISQYKFTSLMPKLWVKL